MGRYFIKFLLLHKRIFQTLIRPLVSNDFSNADLALADCVSKIPQQKQGLTRGKTENRGGGEGTPYSGLYGEAPLERGTFIRLQVYKRAGISQV